MRVDRRVSVVLDDVAPNSYPIGMEAGMMLPCWAVLRRSWLGSSSRATSGVGFDCSRRAKLRARGG
jgi:hypothetical protein